MSNAPPPEATKTGRGPRWALFRACCSCVSNSYQDSVDEPRSPVAVVQDDKYVEPTPRRLLSSEFRRSTPFTSAKSVEDSPLPAAEGDSNDLSETSSLSFHPLYPPAETDAHQFEEMMMTPLQSSRVVETDDATRAPSDHNQVPTGQIRGPSPSQMRGPSSATQLLVPPTTISALPPMKCDDTRGRGLRPSLLMSPHTLTNHHELSEQSHLSVPNYPDDGRSAMSQPNKLLSLTNAKSPPAAAQVGAEDTAFDHMEDSLWDDTDLVMEIDGGDDDDDDADATEDQSTWGRPAEVAGNRRQPVAPHGPARADADPTCDSETRMSDDDGDEVDDDDEEEEEEEDDDDDEGEESESQVRAGRVAGVGGRSDDEDDSPDDDSKVSSHHRRGVADGGGDDGDDDETQFESESETATDNRVPSRTLIASMRPATRGSNALSSLLDTLPSSVDLPLGLAKDFIPPSIFSARPEQSPTLGEDLPAIASGGLPSLSRSEPAPMWEPESPTVRTVPRRGSPRGPAEPQPGPQREQPQPAVLSSPPSPRVFSPASSQQSHTRSPYSPTSPTLPQQMRSPFATASGVPALRLEKLGGGITDNEQLLNLVDEMSPPSHLTPRLEFSALLGKLSPGLEDNPAKPLAVVMSPSLLQMGGNGSARSSPSAPPSSNAVVSRSSPEASPAIASRGEPSSWRMSAPAPVSARDFSLEMLPPSVPQSAVTPDDSHQPAAALKPPPPSSRNAGAGAQGGSVESSSFLSSFVSWLSPSNAGALAACSSENLHSCAVVDTCYPEAPEFVGTFRPGAVVFPGSAPGEWHINSAASTPNPDQATPNPDRVTPRPGHHAGGPPTDGESGVDAGLESDTGTVCSDRSAALLANLMERKPSLPQPPLPPPGRTTPVGSDSGFSGAESPQPARLSGGGLPDSRRSSASGASSLPYSSRGLRSPYSSRGGGGGGGGSDSDGAGSLRRSGSGSGVAEAMHNARFLRHMGVSSSDGSASHLPREAGASLELRLSSLAQAAATATATIPVAGQPTRGHLSKEALQQAHSAAQQVSGGAKPPRGTPATRARAPLSSAASDSDTSKESGRRRASASHRSGARLTADSPPEPQHSPDSSKLARTRAPTDAPPAQSTPIRSQSMNLSVHAAADTAQGWNQNLPTPKTIRDFKQSLPSIDPAPNFDLRDRFGAPRTKTHGWDIAADSSIGSEVSTRGTWV